MTTTTETKLTEARKAVQDWVDNNPEYATETEHFMSVYRNGDPEKNALGTVPESEFKAPEALIPLLNALYDMELDQLISKNAIGIYDLCER